jgi:hypothetical protein
MNRLSQPIGRLHRHERGVVLFVALIVLIVMTLAGLALLRQLGSGTSIAGNVAFKENATSVADRGTEEAMQWLAANPALLASNSFANGYHSTWAGSVDPTTFDWDAESRTVVVNEAGNTVQIYIQRLCQTDGLSALDPAQRCSDFPNENPLRDRGGLTGYHPGLPTAVPQPFYRVTTRVTGPRNTVSFTQVLMQ